MINQLCSSCKNPSIVSYQFFATIILSRIKKKDSALYLIVKKSLALI